jgi:hypothetical protein
MRSKSVYTFDSLNLPERHREADLRRGLITNPKRFLVEFGRDSCCVGEAYPIQVGKRDFAIARLLFHRSFQCLVAIELKRDWFQPAHVGQWSFYLKALDRNVRKEHEYPSVGVLLCTTRDAAVAEYALSRTQASAMVVEYKTLLPE